MKRYHYDNHDQLRCHLSDFIDACNYARRLKALCGLTPYEHICKIPTSGPSDAGTEYLERNAINLKHQVSLNALKYMISDSVR